MNIRLKTSILWLLFFILSAAQQIIASENLIVYCGITMLKPMEQIVKIFEKQHGCKVRLINGGSGKLMNLLLENKNGDLFLPGSDLYIKKIMESDRDLITAQAHIGFNTAAIFVKKGNPKGIKPDLDSLLNPDYKVIIGSSEIGSIGKETKAILSLKGIYDDVLAKSVITMHSQSLVNAVGIGNIDVTINWFAVSTWVDNMDIVEAYPINVQYAKKKKLILALLKDSANPYLSKKFFNLVSSERGQVIFKQYGLGR